MTGKLVFRRGEIEYMKLCFDVTLYWTGSVYEHQVGVVEFYRTAIQLIGHSLKYYATEAMSHAEPIAPETFDLLPSWLERPDLSRDILTLNLESNSVPDRPSDLALDFWAVEYPPYPAGVIRLILPVRFMQGDPSKLIDVAKRLAWNMTFHSGHGGYAINWDHKGEYAMAARKEMSILSRRYPGIDLPEIPLTLMAIPTGIKRVNWLTFIGDELLEQIGGNDVLKQLADGVVLVEELPKGELVIAGQEPRIGDVNRKEDLGAYHQVGLSLAAIRSKDHPPFLVDRRGFPQEDITNSWLGYFES